MPISHDKSPGERLRTARIKAGYERAVHAAERIGIPPPTYTPHENGTRDFGREQCLQYATEFSVDPAWLMFGDIYPRRPLRDAPAMDCKHIPSASSNELELLNVTIGGEGFIKIVHSSEMSNDRAKALLKNLIPTLLP